MDDPSQPSGYEFGDFRVALRQRLLMFRVDGRALPLSARAFDALLLFLEHPGELLDKSRLMKAVWPNVVVEENNLNQQISALRRLLGEQLEAPRFIVTVPGRGYRFIAPVRAVFEAAAGTAAPGSKPPSQSSRQRALLWSALGVAVLIVAAAYLVHRSVSKAAPAVTSIEVTPFLKPRLAVLPFENLSPDPNNAFFADGLHEEIIRTIAERLPGVEVISRTTMMSYRTDPPKAVAVVARELRASHVLEGSVRRERDQIRLTLQLIDARTDGQIWSANYDRTVADTLKLESQVAEEVAAQLPDSLLRTQQSASAPVRDTQAFDLYLKALIGLRMHRGTSTEEFNAILALLDQVIARDPNFAPAYAQRARLRTLRFMFSRDTSEAIVGLIRSDLDHARELAPKDPLVLAATGFFLMCTNDTSGALAAYAAAEAAGLADPEWLNPKAHLLLRRSRVEEVNTATQRLLALAPADPQILNFAVYNYMRLRQPREALRVAQYVRDSDRGWSAFLMLQFTGNTQPFRELLEKYAPTDDPSRLSDSLPNYFTLLRLEHRYTELRALIDRVPVASALYFSGVDYGPVSPTPTALFRGWADLLLEDRASAAKDGRVVLDFVERQPKTRWNSLFLGILSAEGLTFTGECARARDTARTALAGVSRADNAIIWITAAQRVAQIEAWCGGHEDAIELLRQLSSGRPGIAPAFVARDPIFTLSLGKDPAFQALAAQLEIDMHAMAGELERP